MSLKEILEKKFGKSNVVIKVVKEGGALSGTERGTISELMAKPGEKVIEVRNGQSVGHVKAQ